MKRSLLVKVHIALTLFFLPFLLLMPLSGTLYLLGEKGTQIQSPAFKVFGEIPRDGGSEEFWRQEFAKRKLGFSFEYIKSKGSALIFRPSSRAHYIAKITDTGATVSLLEPDLAKMLMELHKGHGPGLFKKLQTAFGIGLLLVVLSGLFLAVSIAAYKKTLFVSFLCGSLVFFCSFVL